MPQNFERLNVMIVDDNVSMRHLLKEILLAFGIVRIAECSDGKEALSHLKSFQADAIFADWMMEPMNGLEMARSLRTDSDRPYIPIIMLTGHTERHRVEEARDAGVTEFLAKPISANAVYQRLQEIVKRPRSFIKAPGFAGPDRRRRVANEPDIVKRRAADQEEPKSDKKPPDGPKKS
jgi:CheY-like chemotaxis protein